MTSELKASAPFAAPLVDRLTVRVIVDSFYEWFHPKSTHSQVTIEHIGRIPGKERSTLAGEYGLSLHLESELSGTKCQYLLDFGYTHEVLIRNLDLLDVDPKRLNGLILSHGHRDHYGGLQGFVERYREAMRDDLQLYAGGEGNFRERWLPTGGEPASWGALDRDALHKANVRTVCCDTAQVLSGPFTTGKIARDSFEHVLPNTMIQQEDHFTPEERRGKLVHDDHQDEHGTCYIIRDRGLVVICSCGHAGLINTIQTAMAVCGVNKLHAVIGGFHLGTAPPDYVQHTVTELKRLAPDVVVPMHCSGLNFVATMREQMPKQLVTSNLGTRFTFGA